MKVTDQQLDSLIKKQTLVSIKRDEISTRSLQAIPVKYSKKLLAVVYVYDFRVDGLLIIRREDITSLNCTKTDKFQKKILIQNGAYKDEIFKLNPPISSFTTLCNSLKPTEIISIEEESLEYPLYYIGKFIGHEKEYIHLHEFTGIARWLKTLTHIHKTDITCAQLRTSYINNYSNYFEGRKPTVTPKV